MNLMILAYFSGRWPWLMPYYFSVKFPILMAIRTYTFVKQDWGYFMLDWCGCSPPLPGPLPRYHGCHPQVSPLKTSDLEPPNRRQTPLPRRCYFANIMLLAFLWTPLRHNPNVFTAMFCIAHGPLPWAVRVGLCPRCGAAPTAAGRLVVCAAPLLRRGLPCRSCSDLFCF